LLPLGLDTEDYFEFGFAVTLIERKNMVYEEVKIAT
jgi:hypothetical protein